MKQVVYTFGDKKDTPIIFLAVESDFVFSSVIITNIHKALKTEVH